jgi:triosephosphate isomerase
MAPQPLIAGNWKMNGTPASAHALAGDLASRARAARGVLPRIALCPPFPLLADVGRILAGSPIDLGAQDCHARAKGAHTGDVSALLLADMGCRFVIVGHSERRADHGETDAQVCAKAQAVLAAKLVPIICVGETEAERDRGETAAVVERQVRGSVPGGVAARDVIIAYEPVWAIGTGRTPTPADVEAVHGVVRKTFGDVAGSADDLAILYGGSVKGSNAASLLKVPGVDGALVGGASLDAADFWKIVEAAIG